MLPNNVFATGLTQELPIKKTLKNKSEDSLIFR